jgi:hypothetical protein
MIFYGISPDCDTVSSPDYRIFCEFIKLDKKEFTVLGKILCSRMVKNAELL